jgi:hypothetical protein
MIGFHQCPGQYNDIDCGLFCVAIVLHVLDDKPATKGIFNFSHCILLQSKLAAHFNCDNNAYEQTSQVVQDCFPQQRVQTSSVAMGLRLLPLTLPVGSKPSIEDTKNDDDVIVLSREDVEIDDKTANKAKTPPTILPESNIAAMTREPATMMTTQPMGTVNQVTILKAMLQAMQRMPVKVAFLC